MREETGDTSERITMCDQMVVILLGSGGDRDHAEKIAGTLKNFGVPYEIRVGSAHKTPEHVIQLIRDYTESDMQFVFITVAGLSNALGGFVDFQTTVPVISSPPYSEKFAGADIYSSLRMPSGSAALTAAEPGIAALAAIKILSLNNPELSEKYRTFQKELQDKIIQADAESTE